MLLFLVKESPEERTRTAPIRIRYPLAVLRRPSTLRMSESYTVSRGSSGSLRDLPEGEILDPLQGGGSTHGSGSPGFKR